MTKENDPLVKAVEAAIEHIIQNHGYGPHVARAAIKAVLEWYSDPDNVNAGMVQAIYSHIGDDTFAESANGFSAAMRAELKRREAT